MKRSPLRPVSRKRARENRTKAPIREAVFERDGACRLRGVGECFGPLTPHHVRKASQGGEYSVDNLVALCAHHNGLLESDADFAALARRLGLVIRRGG